jgi:Domain of unknown function (DUF4214)
MATHTGGLMRDSIASLIALRGKDFVCRCYEMLLGREIDTEGFRHYTALLDNGHDKRTILRDILASNEFRTRHGNPTFAIRYRQLLALSKLPLLGPLANAIRVRNFERDSLDSSALAAAREEFATSEALAKQTHAAIVKLENEVAVMRTANRTAVASADPAAAALREDLAASQAQVKAVREAIAKLEKEFAAIRGVAQNATIQAAAVRTTPAATPARDSRLAAEKLLTLIEHQIKRH